MVRAQSTLWVQPVLAQHGDELQPSICLFAAENIPPWTELTYDYGQVYVKDNLGGRCHCGAAHCHGDKGPGGAIMRGEEQGHAVARGLGNRVQTCG